MILGREIGFTLTLAGIAGFIVAVGITADSFVVFFERIKDEVHEGRSMRVAVPRERGSGLAARSCRPTPCRSWPPRSCTTSRPVTCEGFAFTLGLSTILDLVVVFLFTHPLDLVSSRGARSFGSARFTGLDSAREGGVVKSAADNPNRFASGTPPRRDESDRESLDAASGPTQAVVSVAEARSERGRRTCSLDDLGDLEAGRDSSGPVRHQT